MQSPGREADSSTVAGGQSFRRRCEDGFVCLCAWLATTFYRWAGDWRGWRPLLTRTSAHLAVVAAAAAVIGLSSVEWWPAQAASLAPVVAPRVSAGHAEDGATVGLAALSGRADRVLIRNGHGINGAVGRIAQPHTEIPKRPRLDVITYTVQADDTVESIAASFELEPTTLMWANPAIEDLPDMLRIGQQVVILPINGAYHKVVAGDTLASIAQTYQVMTETIATCEYNDLRPPYRLREGTWLVIPGGQKPYVPKIVTAYEGPVPEGARGTGLFQWPVLGRITQEYWYGHRAIDIGAPAGSAVQAADGGFVSFVGWTDVGYGNLIVIDHANGFATYYAHLGKVYVFVGQAVERGQVIGAVGSTGWSTGPHLHFEIRYYGDLLNPRAHLP